MDGTGTPFILGAWTVELGLLQEAWQIVLRRGKPGYTREGSGREMPPLIAK